jgi:serine protein kinase
VLVRLHRPQKEHYPEEIQDVVEEMDPLQKARLYSEAVFPENISGKSLKTLQNNLKKMAREYRYGQLYEGSSGASPRAILTVLFNALERGKRPFLSPLAVLEEIEAVCKDKSLYDFMRREPLGGGFFEPEKALELTESHLLDVVEKEMWEAVGLVEEQQVSSLLERYVLHASCFVKDESLRSTITGQMEKADEKLMERVEDRLGVSPGKREAYRNDIITRIAAWALAHDEGPPPVEEVFAREMKQLKSQVLDERRGTLRWILQDTITVLDDGDEGLSQERREKATSALKHLQSKLGYTRDSAREAIGLYLSRRADTEGEEGV